MKQGHFQVSVTSSINHVPYLEVVAQVLVICLAAEVVVMIHSVTATKHPSIVFTTVQSYSVWLQQEHHLTALPQSLTLTLLHCNNSSYDCDESTI